MHLAKNNNLFRSEMIPLVHRTQLFFWRIHCELFDSRFNCWIVIEIIVTMWARTETFHSQSRPSVDLQSTFSRPRSIISLTINILTQFKTIFSSFQSWARENKREKNVDIFQYSWAYLEEIDEFISQVQSFPVLLFPVAVFKLTGPSEF